MHSFSNVLLIDTREFYLIMCMGACLFIAFSMITFAPRSNIREKFFLFGITEQIAGLSIPSIIPISNLERIIIAAVFPADTKPESVCDLTNSSPL